MSRLQWLKEKQPENSSIQTSKKKVNVPKEILSTDQIKQIAKSMSSDVGSLPEREAKLAAASAAQKRVVKRAWNLKLRFEQLVEAKKRARKSTKRK